VTGEEASALKVGATIWLANAAEPIEYTVTAVTPKTVKVKPVHPDAGMAALGMTPSVIRATAFTQYHLTRIAALLDSYRGQRARLFYAEQGAQYERGMLAKIEAAYEAEKRRAQ
jgi:hypothetical protein